MLLKKNLKKQIQTDLQYYAFSYYRVSDSQATKLLYSVTNWLLASWSMIMTRTFVLSLGQLLCCNFVNSDLGSFYDLHIT